MALGPRGHGKALSEGERWTLVQYLLTQVDASRTSQLRHGAIQQASSKFKVRPKSVRSVWSTFQYKLARRPGQPDASNLKKGRVGRRPQWTSQELVDKLAAVPVDLRGQSLRRVAEKVGISRGQVQRCVREGLLELQPSRFGATLTLSQKLHRTSYCLRQLRTTVAGSVPTVGHLIPGRRPEFHLPVPGQRDAPPELDDDSLDDTHFPFGWGAVVGVLEKELGQGRDTVRGLLPAAGVRQEPTSLTAEVRTDGAGRGEGAGEKSGRGLPGYNQARRVDAGTGGAEREGAGTGGAGREGAGGGGLGTEGPGSGEAGRESAASGEAGAVGAQDEGAGREGPGVGGGGTEGAGREDHVSQLPVFGPKEEWEAPPPEGTVWTWHYDDDIVHIDMQWFQVMRDGTKFLVRAGEPVPERSVRHKADVTKVMFICAVARPRWDLTRGRWFDGKIGCWPLLQSQIATRDDCWCGRPAGSVELGPVSLDRDLCRKMLVEGIIPGIKALWPGGPTQRRIWIQQDDARPSVLAGDRAVEAAGREGGWNISLRNQPAQSPDFNVLDLGFSRAVASVAERRHATEVLELVGLVQQSWERQGVEDLDNAFLTLQCCLSEVLRTLGGNQYKVPRMKKHALRNANKMPLLLTVDPEVVMKARRFLKDNGWSLP